MNISEFMKPIEQPELPKNPDSIPEESQEDSANDEYQGDWEMVDPEKIGEDNTDITEMQDTENDYLLENQRLKEGISADESGKAKEEGTSSEADETKSEGLTDEEKAKIKEETGWSDEIIDNIKNMKQYEVLKRAGLKEVEINGRKCLVKENIDLDYTDEDGMTNRERMERGLPPLDSKTGKPIELHHLGQKADSPLVELTEEEHRTGEYEDGKKNQSLWHDNAKETEVHGEGNNWSSERREHWKERAKTIQEG